MLIFSFIHLIYDHKYFEYFMKNWSISSNIAQPRNIFPSKYLGYMVCCGMQWNFVAYYCCMGVYTSNNHSQQGQAKFVLQSEGV